MTTTKSPTTWAVFKDGNLIGWTNQNYLPDHDLRYTTKKAIKGLPRLILTSDGVREVK